MYCMRFHSSISIQRRPASPRWVFGHSHQPLIETRQGVLFLNPGSAGPRRFKLPIAVARIAVSGRYMHPEILELRV